MFKKKLLLFFVLSLVAVFNYTVAASEVYDDSLRLYEDLKKNVVSETSNHVHTDECLIDYNIIFGEDLSDVDVICSYCNYGTLIYDYSYGFWYTSGSLDCVHYIWGYDVIEARAVIWTYSCNLCRRGWSESYLEERIKECRGTNIVI